MRPLYALTLQTDGDRLDDLAEDLRAWLARKYPAWNGEPADGAIDLGRKGHVAYLTRETLPGGRMLRFTLEHPDDRVGHRVWHATLELASDGVETELDVVLATFTTRDGVGPPAARIVRPPFLRHIAERYPLRVEREPLARRPLRVDARQDAWKLAVVLCSSHRLLPLVLVADAPDQGPPVDVHRLQRRLLGVGRVASLSAEALEGLRQALERSYWALRPGAVRLCWPGFRPSDDRFAHPLYPPELVADLEARNRHAVADTLFERITTSMAIRTRRSPLLQRLRAAAAAERLAEIERLRKQLAARPALDPDERDTYETLLEEAQAQVEQLLQEKQKLEEDLLKRDEEVGLLQRQLQTALDNLRALGHVGPPPDAPTEAPEPTPLTIFLSEQARRDYDRHPERRAAFDRLLGRLADPAWRQGNAAACSGGGYVCPRSNSDERLFFALDDGRVLVCRLFPHHQDSLKDTYLELRNRGFAWQDYEPFAPWPEPQDAGRQASIRSSR